MQGEIYGGEREREARIIYTVTPLFCQYCICTIPGHLQSRGIRMSSCPSKANSDTPLRTDQFASSDKVEHSDHLLVEVAG
jgi:hypothetical protein